MCEERGMWGKEREEMESVCVKFLRTRAMLRNRGIALSMHTHTHTHTHTLSILLFIFTVGVGESPTVKMKVIGNTTVEERYKQQSCMLPR